MRDFIKSWKILNKGYDLTVFNQKIIFVVNDDERNLSVHIQKLS